MMMRFSFQQAPFGKGKFLSLFLGFIILLTSVYIFVLPESVSAKKISEMSPAEEVKSFLYYNSLRACIEGHQLNNANGDRISVDNATSGQWFYRGDGVSPTAGYYLSVANGVEIQEKIHCGTGDNSWIIDAARLWGYSDGIDMLCDTGASRVNGSDCRDGSDGFHGVRMGFALVNNRLKLDTFENNISNKVYGGSSTNALRAESLYLLNRNVFYAGCLESVSPSPYTGSANDDYTYRDVVLINGSDGTTSKVNFYGKKKASDKVGKLINNGRNNVTASCADLVKEMNGYSSSYAQWVRDEIEAGNVIDEDDADRCADNSDAPGCSDGEATTCAIDGIGWILCPVMNFLGNIADGAFNFLSNNFLETNSRVVSAGDDNPVYTAWQAMRNLANALFVIAFIIIIYSQMTGAGISNYGVKRMLPRLVIAAVLVNVSFFICQLAVDLSNVLGYSLRNFFEGLASSATGGVQLDIRGQTVGPDGSGGTFFGGLVTVVLASAAVYVFASALLPVLLGAVVALVMILFILLARQALIILLIVVAPVAFVAYLLPNTQKLFDKWRKMFVALLLVFPIIGLVFGASMFASAVVTAGSNPVDTDTGNLWGQIIGAGIAILPLFIVPGILKKSLDGVGSIGARINSIGGKLTGAANKKGASMYGNSRLAQYKGYRAQNAARRRNLIQTGAYKGGKFDPLNAVSAMNRKVNSMSGNFGGRLEARGAKLLQDQDEEAEKEDLARYNMMDDAVRLKIAEADLDMAIKAGDGRKAKVAAKALLGSGAIGRDTIKGVLRGKELDAGVSEKLRGAFAGDSDVALATYSYKGEHIGADGKKAGATFSAVEQDAATYSGKNAEQLATLSPASMKIAMDSGGISDRIAQQMLTNPSIKLSDAQADAVSQKLRSAVGSPGAVAGGPSSSAGESWSRRTSTGQADGTSGAAASESPSSPGAEEPAQTPPPDEPTPGAPPTPPL